MRWSSDAIRIRETSALDETVETMFSASVPDSGGPFRDRLLSCFAPGKILSNLQEGRYDRDYPTSGSQAPTCLRFVKTRS